MDNPLVSVVVATYNSSATICETLDSIANQTYHNVELIVTDDCSKDNTIDIVTRWLDENGNRFINTELVTVAQNTGTSANLNRGIQRSQGIWIKTIAGDDNLKCNCLSSFMNYASSGEGQFYLCDLDLFSNDGGSVDKFYVDSYIYYFECVKESKEEKKRRIIHEYKLPGPGWFFTRFLYNEVGGFEEKYRLLEEWPFVYNVLKKGYDIIPVEEKLVNYRITNTSVCHSYNTGLINRQLFLDRKFFFKDTLRKELIRKGFIFEVWSKTLEFYVIDKLYNNPKGLKRKLILSIRLLDPIGDFRLIQSLFRG